ncbi:MAG: hypothetical protein B6D63_04950 [Candidatus Latescibacteria bacterium 4484_7]|nr:MAG: hypothetical protein B6D63_04950 [Candidatus Latescibacteria bacterium 4484_7]
MLLKVCFFSPTAYSYFDKSKNLWAGGAEIQQVLVAREMAARGIEVSFIVGDYGQDDVEVFGDITVIKSFAPFKGNRKLRFILDMLKIYRAMKIADADVYNQRSTSFYTGQLAYFAARLKKKFTFSIGIDYNCLSDCGGFLPKIMCRLYRYGIRKADAVIAQTEQQKKLLRENFDVEATLIRNGIYIPTGTSHDDALDKVENALQGKEKTREFLWVGSFRKRKRPELFVELARRIPEARFTLIGGVGDDKDYYEKIVKDAEKVENLRYVGFVPPERIDSYYRKAFALINTSYLEGFPNTYLHSWIYGTPTLTIEIDPDGIIEREGIGRKTGSFEELVRSARELCSDENLRNHMSQRAWNYVRKNHDIKDRSQDYIELFERLIAE